MVTAPMPVPAAASANAAGPVPPSVEKRSKNRSIPDGVKSTSIRPGVVPAFCHVCGTPRGTKTNDPAGAASTSSLSRNWNVPSSTIRHSSSCACVWSGGPSPGGTVDSSAVRPPFVSSPRNAKTMSPPTAFRMGATSPRRRTIGSDMVCTHARRDVCCGTHGVPVYNALRRHVPRELLWRSSHQGGHRFAANVLALPEAVQLGRVLPEAAGDVAGALAERRIPLRFYRGRALHAPEVQAADAAVRTALGLDRLADVRLVEHDGPHVVLATPNGPVEVTVVERQGPMLPASCGKEAEPMHVLEAIVQGLGD